MKEELKTTEELLTRRHFMQCGAGAVLATSCFTSLGAGARRGAATRTYVCPPCGLPCDKLAFDKPGDCTGCGMKLVPVGGDDSPPTVAILLFNGAQIIDFAGPWEVFGTAGFLVHTVAEKLEPMTMVFGQRVVADYTFEKSPKADILLVPGGGISESMKNPRLIQWIQTKAKDVKYVISVCTGALLLGKAGLLEGQTATATYGMVDDLLEFPNTRVVYDKRYVDSGKIITTAGLSSGIDGAIHLVSKMSGMGEAQSVALRMEYHWEPDSEWARSAMADRYLPDGLAYGKANIRGAEAKLISTAGNADRWETKILVSEPDSSTKIMDVLRERISANRVFWGMSNHVSHIRSAPRLSPVVASGSQLTWMFVDDQGRSWHGTGGVTPSPDEKAKFIVTVQLERSTK